MKPFRIPYKRMEPLRPFVSVLVFFLIVVSWIVLGPQFARNVMAMVSAASGSPQSPEKKLSQAQLDRKVSEDFFSEIGEDNLLSHDDSPSQADPPSEVFEKGMSLTVDLSLDRAVELAIESNLLTRIADESENELRGKEWQAVSVLLPHVDATSYIRRTAKENLKALGFKAGGLIGPFDTIDGRFEFTQKLLDLSAFARFQASKIGVKIAEYDQAFARQKVTFLVATAYLEGLRARSELMAVKADLQLSDRLLTQARRQNDAGVATGVDVARAETQLAQTKLRYEKARMDAHDALIKLQRVTWLPFNTAIRLTESLQYVEEKLRPTEEAVALAEEERMEMRIAKDRLRQLKYGVYSAQAERLPKIDFKGDLGVMGNWFDESARLTGGATFRLSMPLFEGGLIMGKIKESKSLHRQQQLSYEDLTRQVEEDVRLALWGIRTYLEQVRAAGQVFKLSKRELQLASNRFAEGIGDNVEVTIAQTKLSAARDGYIAALVQYHIARINLYYAMGQSQSFYLMNEMQP